MNEAEARALLAQEVERLRSKPYAELVARIDVPEGHTVRGPSGVAYGVEVLVVWDARPGGDVRVIASIDDGGLRAFKPLTDGFILSSGGEFVGE